MLQGPHLVAELGGGGEFEGRGGFLHLPFGFLGGLFDLLTAHAADDGILQDGGEVGRDVALVVVGRAGGALGVVAEADGDVAASELARGGDIGRVVVGIGGADAAGGAVAEDGIGLLAVFGHDKAADVGRVLLGGDQFLHQDVGAGRDLRRRDAVELVVFHLFAAPAVGLVDGFLHGAGDRVGVHDDEAVEVAGGASGGLHQGTAAA